MRVIINQDRDTIIPARIITRVEKRSSDDCDCGLYIDEECFGLYESEQSLDIVFDNLTLWLSHGRKDAEFTSNTASTENPFSYEIFKIPFDCAETQVKLEIRPLERGNYSR
ncbi:MAG: hypothetical protein FWG65_05415 [Turicibacter sp.]|nr:hypothetical protein [Turicibacter sp.]